MHTRVRPDQTLDNFQGIVKSSSPPRKPSKIPGVSHFLVQVAEYFFFPRHAKVYGGASLSFCFNSTNNRASICTAFQGLSSCLQFLPLFLLVSSFFLPLPLLFVMGAQALLVLYSTRPLPFGWPPGALTWTCGCALPNMWDPSLLPSPPSQLTWLPSHFPSSPCLPPLDFWLPHPSQ
jgi:hypothetical protein